MAQESKDTWSGFHQAALGRPPRELLTRTLNFFRVEKRPVGVAADLGCGSGPDAAELLRLGWEVHAVDAAGGGLELLRASVPAEAASRLHTHCVGFEDFEMPGVDLVWGSFAFPFCAPDRWPALVERITAALKPGGRFAGDLFGDRHAWAGEAGVMTLTEGQARQSLQGLTLEAFDIEDGLRVSGAGVTRWHAFGFIARKRA